MEEFIEISRKFLENRFKVYDLNGDGVITREEFSEVMKKFQLENKITNEEIEDLMDDLDSNVDDKVEYHGKNSVQI